MSGRVSVPCWHATPVANAPWTPLIIGEGQAQYQGQERKSSCNNTLSILIIIPKPKHFQLCTYKVFTKTCNDFLQLPPLGLIFQRIYNDKAYTSPHHVDKFFNFRIFIEFFIHELKKTLKFWVSGPYLYNKYQ